MGQFYNGVYYKNDIDAKKAKLENEGGNATQFFNDLGDELWTAGKNWWYTVTGQTHKTDAYQYELGLADTAYQRAAADMEAAGLSKFGGVSPAGTPSTKNGSDLLSTAISMQQLKQAKLDFKQQNYDFKKAKKWGVPTSAVGEFAKYDAACKMIFGKSLSEMVGDDGLVGMIKDWIKGKDGSPVPPDPVPTSAAGAAIDALQHVNGDAAPVIEPVYSEPVFGIKSDVYKPAPMELPSIFYDEGFTSHKFSEENFRKPDNISPVLLGGDAEKDMDELMTKMFNDGQLKDSNIERICMSVSDRYNMDYEKVADYARYWIQEHEGEIIYRW